MPLLYNNPVAKESFINKILSIISDGFYLKSKSDNRNKKVNSEKFDALLEYVIKNTVSLNKNNLNYNILSGINK